MIAFGAVAFSVIALLIAGGFIGWILSEMRELSIRTWYGHVQVARAGYWENGAADPIGHLVRDTPEAVVRLARDARVAAVAPRMRFAALAGHGDNTLSFIGEGVDPAAEARFGRSLIFLPGRGNALRAGDEEGAVIGQGLAANLGVVVGDRLVLMANTTSGGGINAIEVTIRGVFLTANKSFDDTTIRIGLSQAHKLMRSRGAHSWAILLHDSGDTVAIAEGLHRGVSSGGLEARPWTRLAENYLKTEALFGRQLGVLSVVLGLLVVLGISNTMTMSVLERTGEIGTTMALGASRRRVLSQFVLEGLVLGVAGGLVGLIVGSLLAALLSKIGIPLPPPPGLDTPIMAEIRVDASLATQAFLTAVLSAVFASIYPAVRASRMIIVDALRQARS